MIILWNKRKGGNGGGGSSKFPTIVTDSGSSLPSASGYQLNDTFLNTSDKKIHKAEVNGYVLNSNVTVQDVDVDLTTGIATGFDGNQDDISRTNVNIAWKGNVTIRLHFKQTQFFPSGRTPVFCLLTSQGVPGRIFAICLKNTKLNFTLAYWSYGPTTVSQETELDYNLSTNTEYYVKVTKTGTSAKAELFTDGYDTTPIASVDFETQDYAYTESSTERFNSYSLGIYAQPNTGLIVYLADTTGDIVIPNTSMLSWDSGTDLTDKTEYADKTNGALYLYENSELVKIGGSLTKKVYTISADNTSTLDVSSDFTKVVDVLKNGVELALTDDYTISSGVITFVTALSTTDKITVKGE